VPTALRDLHHAASHAGAAGRARASTIGAPSCTSIHTADRGSSPLAADGPRGAYGKLSTPSHCDGRCHASSGEHWSVERNGEPGRWFNPCSRGGTMAIPNCSWAPWLQMNVGKPA
jgi:hypothetical protein